VPKCAKLATPMMRTVWKKYPLEVRQETLAFVTACGVGSAQCTCFLPDF